MSGAAGTVVRVVDQLAHDSTHGVWHLLEQEIMRPDAVMVAVPADFTADNLAARLNAAGFATAPAHSGDAVVVILLPEATIDAVPRALAQLDERFPFLVAEPDFLRFSTQTTPDDYSATMWGLANIEAPGAWTVSTGDSTVVVAVLDSGLDGTHPDLAPNLWTNPGEIAGNGVDDDNSGRVDDLHGWDFAANNAAIIDNDGHGTHVSGTIGATGNNGQGVTGVNWNVRLLPLRCGDTSFPDSTLVNALRYVVTLKNLYLSSGGTAGANIVAVNASLGGGGFNSTFRTEIANAGAAGIVFVAAAGNDGTNNDTTPVYPASYDLNTIIAVASIHAGNARSEFSDYGVTSVDLAAPGTGIYSTTRGGAYGFQSGTSMAAPHVSGAIALVAAADPGLTATELRARVLDHVDPVPALDGLVATGGKLNVRRSVAPTLARPLVAIGIPAGAGSGLVPEVEVVAIERAGLSLSLVALLGFDKGVFAPSTIAWDASEGPAGVSFSAPTSIATEATFPVAGRYRVRATRTMAGGGTLQESDEIVVLVGDALEVNPTGLQAHWTFDEAGGVALDASGNNRTGTFNGALRGGGVRGSAATFNGTTDNIAFTSPSLSRVTIAGWARATGGGNSPFPRVVHMREGLLFFGLDGGSTADDGNDRTLKFALDDGGTSPVWYTPPGSIATNTWYHVAVSYDPTVASPTPTFYINGAPQIFGTQATGAATNPTVGIGQGFIGDRGDAMRVWQGALDEIRIYNRELSASEFAVLGHEMTLRALATGYLGEVPHADPLSVPLIFSPADSGPGTVPPTFAATTWSVNGDASVTFTVGETSATLNAPSSGEYVVRFDGTTSDGVHVVRTVTVPVIEETVQTDGYYTGTTGNGGSFALIVHGTSGRFYGAGDHGVFGPSFTVASWGAFNFTVPHGQTWTAVSGQIDATGVITGTIAGATTFTGSRLTTGLSADQPALDGDYAGWVLDSGIRASARIEQGRVALVISEDGAQRAAEGVINSSGTFALSPVTDATFNGTAGANRLVADFVVPGESSRRVVLLRDGHDPERRLANLSLRGRVGTGESALIPGFVVRGVSALPMLIRGVGPGLAGHQVTGFITQPRLQLFVGGIVAAENFGWATAPDALDVAAAGARLGAFALNPLDVDSALLRSLSEDTYTAIITGADGGTGVVLAEVYDARLGAEDARLVNLSGRGFVGTGDDLLIGGFVITGTAPALVLVRGVGPSLGDYGVDGALAAPQLTLYRGATEVASGQAWGDGQNVSDIVAASNLTGAFTLTDGSADAALLLFLEPGDYTAHLRGVADTTGVGLVEVYLVPDF